MGCRDHRLGRVWGAFRKLKERTKPEPLTVGKEWPPLGQERAKGKEAGLRKVVGPAGGGTGRSWVTSSARPVSLESAENGINVDGPASCPRSAGGPVVPAHFPKTTDAEQSPCPTSRLDFCLRSLLNHTEEWSLSHHL